MRRTTAPALPKTGSEQDDVEGRQTFRHMCATARLAAVLDLGGLAIGDPTVDLVVAWEVLDREMSSVTATEGV